MRFLMMVNYGDAGDDSDDDGDGRSGVGDDSGEILLNSAGPFRNGLRHIND